MRDTNKQSLLQEIRESEGRQASANPLTGLMQEVARMPRLARSKQCSRTGSLPARKRRSRLPRTGYLANPASLIGIPRLEAAHAGNRSASVRPPSPHWLKPWWKSTSPLNRTGSPQRKTPPHWSSMCFRRYLADHGQSIIAEHFELSLTLGEAIVDSSVRRVGADLPRPTLLRSQYGVILCLGRG